MGVVSDRGGRKETDGRHSDLEEGLFEESDTGIAANSEDVFKNKIEAPAGGKTNGQRLADPIFFN